MRQTREWNEAIVSEEAIVDAGVFLPGEPIERRGSGWGGEERRGSAQAPQTSALLAMGEDGAEAVATEWAGSSNVVAAEPSVYVGELRDFFRDKKMQIGDAAGVVELAAKLSEGGSFSDELRSMVRVVVFREGGVLPGDRLLDIVLEAAGGEDFDGEAPEAAAAVRQIVKFLTRAKSALGSAPAEEKEPGAETLENGGWPMARSEPDAPYSNAAALPRIDVESYAIPMPPADSELSVNVEVSARRQHRPKAEFYARALMTREEIEADVAGEGVKLLPAAIAMGDSVKVATPEGAALVAPPVVERKTLATSEIQHLFAQNPIFITRPKKVRRDRVMRRYSVLVAAAAIIFAVYFISTRPVGSAADQQNAMRPMPALSESATAEKTGHKKTKVAGRAKPVSGDADGAAEESQAVNARTPAAKPEEMQGTVQSEAAAGSQAEGGTTGSGANER